MAFSLILRPGLVTNAQISKLECVDNALLSVILQAHSKTPSEFVNLETGTVPLRWIISQRRINYLRYIMSRSDEELIKKVFLAQKDQPTKGDFVKLVEKDLSDLGLSFEHITSGKINKKKFKKTLSLGEAFKKLLLTQKEHSKVNKIKYEELTLQPYLKSRNIKQKEAKMFTALRSNFLREIRHN